VETIEIFAIICAVFGIIGSIVPGLPGPPVSWVGLLLTFFAVRDGSEPMTTTFLLVWLGITTLVTVLDYVIPAWFTRVTGGHKAASVGAILGLFAGMFLLPVGMLVGSLLGAFLGEFLVEDKGVWESFKASVGAFLGFICSTGLKLVVSGIMMYHIIQYLF
jgi:uncharacterized protein YqgC (DUF456 family)